MRQPISRHGPSQAVIAIALLLLVLSMSAARAVEATPPTLVLTPETLASLRALAGSDEAFAKEVEHLRKKALDYLDEPVLSEDYVDKNNSDQPIPLYTAREVPQASDDPCAGMATRRRSPVRPARPRRGCRGCLVQDLG